MNINESYIFICQFSIVFLDLLAHPGIFFWVVFLPIRGSASADSIRSDGRSHGAMVKGACHPNGPMLRCRNPEKSGQDGIEFQYSVYILYIYIYCVYHYIQ